MSHPITKLVGVALAAWLLGRAASEFTVAEWSRHETARLDAAATATATAARGPLPVRLPERTM